MSSGIRFGHWVAAPHLRSGAVSFCPERDLILHRRLDEDEDKQNTEQGRGKVIFRTRANGEKGKGGIIQE